MKTSEKDYQNQQMENFHKEIDETDVAELLQRQEKNYDTNRRPQCELYRLRRQADDMLHRIFELMQVESIKYPDCLPTSFVNVERKIAKCISGCLHDVPEQSRSISNILTLLRDYKVVGYVPGQKPSVSLDQLFLILQDNYADSFLCKLFYIFLTGIGVQTKVITFS